MTRVRYVGDELRQVSILPAGTLRLLEPDELFTVPDEHVESYACQPGLYDVGDEHAPKKKTRKEEG